MRLHRLAWALHFGAWPVGPLDHRNRSRADNRIANLRIALPSENSRNRAASSRTGYLGVRIAPSGTFFGNLRALSATIGQRSASGIDINSEGVSTISQPIW